MKRAVTLLAVTVVLAVACTTGSMHAKEEQPKKKEVLFVPADKAEFKEVISGVSKASLWGDQNNGLYGAFTKFKPGQDNGMHTHTNDISIVVVKGAYLYKDSAGEKRVSTGGFLFVPGGTKHWSGGDAKEGALFYEESSGKFDFLPAK